MKLPAYPRTKPSGVEWLGDVPEHWEVKRLSYLVTLKSGENITSEMIAEGGDFPVYGGNGLRGNYHKFTHRGHHALIGRQGALCGNINYASGEFYASEHALVVSPLKELAVVWMGELLRAMNLGQYSVTAAQPGIAAEMIRGLRIPVPPLSEQRAIAAFLDRETGRVDRLVAKKRELIERLKEKRTALISRTVTRGLPPGARTALSASQPAKEDRADKAGRAATALKPSGLDWLGDIPKHWEAVRLKHLLKLRKGAVKTGPFGSQLQSAEMMDGEIKVYNQRSVIDRNLTGGENYISLEKFDELRAFEVFPNDLLVTTRGTIGRCAVLPVGSDRGILHPCLMRVQFDPRRVHNRFVEILIQDSGRVLEQLELKSNATTIDVIYSESLREVWFALPPLLEQAAIAAYLDEETAKLDALVGKVELAVERLQEYRTALITAVVTGKIDVRRESHGKQV